MYYRHLTDEEILKGFRMGNSHIIRKYFYGYCTMGYNIFDKRYQLSSKQNLDFMSLAHQYALYLMEHDWRPLEDHSPNVSPSQNTAGRPLQMLITTLCQI